jgi:hypothetical protein
MPTFLTNLASIMNSGILLPLVVGGISMCIPIVAIITEYHQKKNKLRVIEKAIEHGVNPDDLQLDKVASADGCPRLPYRGGMICLAVGIALSLAGYYLTLPHEFLDQLLIIGGAVTGLVGVALLINDKMNRDRFEEQKKV